MTRRQLDILYRIGVQVHTADPPREDLIIDALIGYSLSGPPTGASASLIRAANGHAAPVLALDVPSGLDATSGKAHDPAIKADATMILALPKTGLCTETARENVGELFLADIGVPPELYAAPGLKLTVGPLFDKDDIIRLR